MIYVVAGLCVTFLFLAEVGRLDDHDAVKAIILSLSKFTLLFCAISILLFSIDRFWYRYALISELLFSVLYCAAFCRKNKKNFKIRCSLNNVLIPLIICCVAIPFTAQKAEYFGMGQDEGVYQTEAIYLANNGISLYRSFDEYDVLPSAEEKTQYVDFLEGAVGYYRLDHTLSMEEYSNKSAAFEKKDETTGVYHGIHVFSALLGLWIKLFGIRNMLGIITLLYFCSIFLFYYSLQNLRLKRSVTILSATLFAFSPLILWLSKTTYSESLVILALCLYLFYFTIPEKKTGDVFSMGVSAAYMSCVHIMFLVLYPVFWLVNIIFAAWNIDRRYLKNNVIMAAAIIAFSISFSATSLYYYYYNLGLLFVEPVITIDNILIWIIAGALISAPLGLAAFRIITNIDKTKTARAIVLASRVLICLSMVYVCWHFYQFGYGLVEETVYNAGIIKTGKAALFHSSIWALICYCGVLVFPYTFVAVFSCKKEDFKTDIQVNIILLFTWFAVVYGAVMKSEVWYYFYYSRYLGYVIPVVLLFFADRVNEIKRTEIFRVVAIGIPAVSLVCMLAIDVPSAVNKDDTFIEWDTLESIAEEVDPGDAIIIDQPLQLKYALALKELTGAGVYPVMSDFNNQEAVLKDNYEDVFILSDEEVEGKAITPDEKYGVELKINNESSIYRLLFIGGFRFENYQDTQTITLYKQNE